MASPKWSMGVYGSRDKQVGGVYDRRHSAENDRLSGLNFFDGYSIVKIVIQSDNSC